MGKVIIWRMKVAGVASEQPEGDGQEHTAATEVVTARCWFEEWTTRVRSAWERRIRTIKFMSRLHNLGLTSEDILWLPRLVNLRLLIVSDQVLLDAMARRPAFILLPSGEKRSAEPDGLVATPAETFYKLLLLSVRSLPLSPETCLLRQHERRMAGREQQERGRIQQHERGQGATIARIGTIVTPPSLGFMVTDHALLNPIAPHLRTVFSLLRGAPSAVLAQCRWVWQPENESGSQVRLLTDAEKARILAATDDLMARSYLPVALAIRHQMGRSLGLEYPAGGDYRTAALRNERSKSAVYLGLVTFDNPLLTGVTKTLAFFYNRGVNVIWESRLPFPLQRAIITSALSGLVLTELPSLPQRCSRHLAYVGRQRTEDAAVCREWEVVRLQAFPDGSGRLQTLGRIPGRIVPVPAPLNAESLLVRLQELYLLAEQAIAAGVKFD